MIRPDYRNAMARSGVPEALRTFDPHVAGTPPLGIDLPSSDIDIACRAPDAAAFAVAIWGQFMIDRPSPCTSGSHTTVR